MVDTYIHTCNITYVVYYTLLVFVKYMYVCMYGNIHTYHYLLHIYGRRVVMMTAQESKNNAQGIQVNVMMM